MIVLIIAQQYEFKEGMCKYYVHTINNPFQSSDSEHHVPARNNLHFTQTYLFATESNTEVI